jgi:hypothetical protein
MSNSSSATLTAPHDLHPNRFSTAKSPTTPTRSSTEMAAAEGESDTSYAARLGLTPPKRDYSSASFCAYAAGQYTDF